jgi:predicted outer membrane protein
MYNAFESYKKNFLSQKDTLAKDDLKRAISLAKSSDDLNHLATIYLGECALNKSVGIDDKCDDFLKIKELVTKESLINYYYLLELDLKKLDPTKLDDRYKDFAIYLKKQEFKKANEAIIDMKSPTSKFIAISLLKDKVSKKTIQDALKTASLHGYKKEVVYLLHLLKDKETNPDKKKIIEKKIEILLK